MARLRRKTLNGNKSSDDSDYAHDYTEPPGRPKDAREQASQPKSRTSPRKRAVKTYNDDCEDTGSDALDTRVVLQPKTTPKKTTGSKQMRLAPLPNSLISQPLPPGARFKPQRLVKVGSINRPDAEGQRHVAEKPSKSDVGESSESVPEVDAEESIWCGSDGGNDGSSDDDDLPSPSKFLKNPPRQKQDASLSKRQPSTTTLGGGLDDFKKLSIFDSDSDAVPKSRTARRLKGRPESLSRPTSSSDKENQGAFLRFSPPRLHSPAKRLTKERPVTPPQSPSKSRLQSPSKTKPRIPTPPHRQSLDAFWDANTVNDWNEHHSPKKILKSPRKLKLLQDDSQQSPTSSPRKNQSPFKRTKAELEAKRAFSASKHRIAEDFLAELDAVVTNGRVRELAQSTGGVRFIWSKTLNSTAGRANWRKETTKTRHQDGTTSSTHKHYASIELAEKVIDDEDRLLNVIAHEFCHLANFMVSGIKDQPHGRQFKEWGRKCTSAFGHRGVKVTTKHSFEIEYKYIWQCSNEDCGNEFKRHSKSIDPKRHTCGSCRSKLVQIKPVPRKTGENGNGSGYAAYVKANYATVRKSLPGASQKEVMEAVAKKYRAEKEARGGDHVKAGVAQATEVVDMDKVSKALETITIEDD